MVLGPHTARGNITQAISHSVEFQADMLRFMKQHNYTRVETRPEKVDEWTRIVIKAGEALLSFKVDSWQNGVTDRAPGSGLQWQRGAFPADDRRGRQRRLPGIRVPLVLSTRSAGLTTASGSA